MSIQRPSSRKEEVPVSFTSFVEVLRIRATEQSDALAYCFLVDGELQEDRITYGELDRRARAVAAKMLSISDKPGDTVLLIYNSSIEYIVGLFATLYAGKIAIPLYPPKRPRHISRLEAAIKSAKASISLTSREVMGALPEEFVNASVMKDLQWLISDEVDLAMAGQWKNKGFSEDNLAYFQYTSGSTGDPKGVMLTNRQLMVNLEILGTWYPADEASVLLHWTPLFHDLGLIFGTLFPIYHGIPCIFFSPDDFVARPIRWMEALDRFRASHSCGPNFAFDLVRSKSTSEQRAGLDLTCLRFLLNCAEPIRASTYEDFVEAFKPANIAKSAFRPGWGLAESSLLIASVLEGQEATVLAVDSIALGNGKVEVVPGIGEEGKGFQRFVGHGDACQDTNLLIVDPNTLECKPSDTVGEIWAKGGSVGSGYFEKPEITKEKFQAYTSDTKDGPYLRTGDLGFFHKGELYICGRAKDVIIIRGANHYPQDIERTAEESHPHLRPGCVAAFSIEIGGQEQVIINQEVRKRLGDALDADGAVRAIRKAVRETHDISVFAINLLKSSTVPKTSSGKIQRSASKRDYLAGTLQLVHQWQQPQPGEAPAVAATQTTASENDTHSPEILRQWLIAKLSEKIRLPAHQIDIHETFDAYGFDSMLAVEMTFELSQWLGRKVSPSAIYDYPTVASLGQHLAASQTQDAPIQKKTIHEKEAIAVVGMACRIPGADNPAAFWELLRNGKEAISEPGEQRKNMFAHMDKAHADLRTSRAGYLKDPVGFDASFFGISPREAENMDPQQRILLEVAWEALENAGIPAVELSGSPTGVYVGVCSNDYGQLQSREAADLNVYQGTGNASSITANRLSYYFNFKGPSLAIDTACSSSLVAVHNACRDLRTGDCDAALAAGVNLILSPDNTYVYSDARMLSPDGRCKTFDAGANGYVRAEGCGVVVLKRLSSAVEDGDEILCLIKGSAVNQDGRSNGLNAPNGPSQEAVIHAALQTSSLVPEQVSYVEAHGTATSLGDPIEMNAIKAVYSQNRDPENPVWVGSVKTNVGHLEGAAGITGLMKCVLALQHGHIPQHLHFQELNPHIDLEGSAIRIPVQAQEWKNDAEALRCGISSFGFGGTNVHAILEQAPPQEETNKSSQKSPQYLIPVSASSAVALHDMVVNLADMLSSRAYDIADLAWTLACRRTHHKHRLAMITGTSEELQAQLKKMALSPAPNGQVLGEVRSERILRTVFVFSGQGPQWWAMGRSLMQANSFFRQQLEDIDVCFRELLSWSPLQALMEDETDSQLFATEIGQAAIFTVQVALARLWMSWGIEPAAVIGHSMGEVAAAHIADAITLDDAVRVIYHRGHSMKSVHGQGNMAVISRPLEATKALLAPYGDELSVAAVNAATSTVISGDAKALQHFLTEMETREIPVTAIRGHYAFHSSQMAPAQAAFAQNVGQIKPLQPTIPIFSSVTGAQFEDLFDVAYWQRNIREPVLFKAALEDLLRTGEGRFHTFIEIGPHPVLLGNVMQSMAATGVEGIGLPSLRRKEVELERMFESLGKMYAMGHRLDWSAILPETGKFTGYPNYPWHHVDYWFETARPQASVKQANAEEVWTAVTEAGRRQANTGPFDLALHSYGEKWETLNALAHAYMQATLVKFGLFAEAGASHTLAEIMHTAGIGETYSALILNWLKVLKGMKLLRQEDETYTSTVSLREANLPEHEAAAQKALADIPFFYDYMKRCGDQLVAVLTGQLSPLETLFPGASYETVDFLYHKWPVARFFNEIAATLIDSWIKARPEVQEFRIMEIGAGTGGIARTVIPILPADKTHYTFTDMSEFFFHRVQDQLAAYPFVDFSIYDAEKDPETQGYTPHSYHIVLAANVLHATHDLEQTLLNARKLLAPGGILVMYELTQHMPWIDVSVALIEGWQIYEDNIRDLCPLVEYPVWEKLLKKTGFTHVTGYPGENTPAEVFGQHIILAGIPDTPLENGSSSAREVKHRAGLRKDWVYELKWEEMSPAEPFTIEDLTENNWLIIGEFDDGKLSQYLLNNGAKVLQVRQKGSKWDDRAAYQDLAKQMSEFGNPDRPWKLIYAQQTSAPDAADPNAEARECLRQTYLAAALAADGWPARSELWFVYQNPDANAQELFAALLWGNARVIDSEYTGWVKGLLHVSPVTTAEQLCRHLCADAEVTEAALDGTGRKALKLHQAPDLGKGPLKQITCDHVGSYLVTGGTGILGMEVAERLVERGAKNLILLARTAFPTRTDWEELPTGHPMSERINRFLKWGNAGVRVHLVQADIAGPAAYAALNDLLKREGVGPLRGIVHAAATLTTKAIPKLEASDIDGILRPKVQGIRLLLDHFKEAELDFCILFSSASSLFGPFGHGAYAGANNYLEHLAVQRSATGSPTTAIAWGVWEDTGSEARPVVESFNRKGLETIDFRAGLDLMEHLTAAGVPCAAVIPGGLKQWKTWVPEAMGKAILAGIRETGFQPMTVQSTIGAEFSTGTFASATPENRKEILTGYLQGVLSRIFRANPENILPHKSLLDLGLDSLMAIELKNRLETELDVVLTVAKLLAGPTVMQLAESLQGEMECTEATTGAGATATDEGADREWESLEL